MKDHNKYYWENKKGRAEIAKKHTEEMEQKYSHEIKECVANTEIHSTQNIYELNTNMHGAPRLSLYKTDTVDTLFKCKTDTIAYRGKFALLNFASYKNPGGGFIIGSRAQEECLCHESFLYNVLKEFEESYYEVNRKDLNRALYREKALYSPDVIFEHDGKVEKCDVITCASPNFSAAEKFVSREGNNEAMRKRIRFVLEIAKKKGIDNLILGAWGCGVFQQDPEFVANCFVEEINKVLHDVDINIIFAVIPPLPNQTDNCTPFETAVLQENMKTITNKEEGAE